MTTTIEAIIERLAERDLLDVALRFAREHNVTVRELVGGSHERAPSWARQALWSFLYSLGHWSYPRLGHLFGRDHSTILAGVRAHLQRTGVAA
jgi:chromosomal replication initiation ATPase DnaA